MGYAIVFFFIGFGLCFLIFEGSYAKHLSKKDNR